MRNLHRYTVVLLLVAASVVAHAQSSLRGKWRGMDGNVPNIKLTVEQNAGRPTGIAVFYLLKKDSEESAPRVEGQAIGPMENLNYQPEKLTFDMHRRDGSVVSFRVELTDATHAKLFRTSEHDAAGSGFDLTRVE
jgi:hypothetical protein